MGKNFSCNNQGQRNEDDLYQTPYSMTEQLLEKEKFNKSYFACDPCCGKHAITKVISKHFYPPVIGTDINLSPSYINFLSCENYGNFDYIITNPPFKLALEFIQKAKTITRKKIAMLLPLSYLHGQERFEKRIFLDGEFPLTKVYVFTRYPLLEKYIREDGKYNTGMKACAWYIWKKGNTICSEDWDKKPVIDWIDNNKYVLSTKQKKSPDKQGQKGIFY